jgi:hypothetical protein
MIDNCLLQRLPLLRLLQVSRRGRDKALKCSFTEIAPTSAFAIRSLAFLAASTVSDLQSSVQECGVRLPGWHMWRRAKGARIILKSKEEPPG